MDQFFYNDGLLMCPVPFPIYVHPKSAHMFFIHILLTHGNYITELNVVHHSSPHEMLQSAQLIGKETDNQSLDVYLSNLLCLYVLNELQYLPKSMRRTDTYIPLVQCLFDDVIIRNKFSATEHPYMMAGLQTSLTNTFNEFWSDNTASNSNLCTRIFRTHQISLQERKFRGSRVLATVIGIPRRVAIGLIDKAASSTMSNYLLPRFSILLLISTSLFLIFKVVPR
jgi:hypothetical protein